MNVTYRLLAKFGLFHDDFEHSIQGPFATQRIERSSMLNTGTAGYDRREQ